MIQTEREYAQALYSLATETNSVDEHLLALKDIKKVVTDEPDYIEFLACPAVPLSERLDCIDKAFGNLPEFSVSFIKVLCENGRIRTLPVCIEEFTLLAMTFSNRTVAQIYSAVELDDKQKQKLCKKLEKITDKIIDPIFTIDKSLIGGIKVDIDGKSYDGSIKHRLGEIKDVMNS